MSVSLAIAATNQNSFRIKSKCKANKPQSQYIIQAFGIKGYAYSLNPQVILEDFLTGTCHKCSDMKKTQHYPLNYSACEDDFSNGPSCYHLLKHYPR